MANTKSRKKVTTKYIMIGCPEDVEKKFLTDIKDAIKEFNEQYSEKFETKLVPRHWRSEVHSAAENVQETINTQLCNECDYLLAVFYCSLGSAIASEDAGTFMEIDYFCKNRKQVFLHRYTGKASVDLSKTEETKSIQDYLGRLDKELSNLTFKDYTDENSLKQGIINDLMIFFQKKTKRTRGNSSKRANGSRKRAINSIQEDMRKHMSTFDDWIAIGSGKLKFSFAEKAKDLIAGMQPDGSVQYYVGTTGRFRTTPTSSTLEALYLAKLLPDTVCYKMQDWVYNSRQDPCDDPGERGKSKGHKPDEKDGPGWSWNEGVSVWATSKALETLIMTGYYERKDVLQNDQIMKTTYEALSWLADQEYPTGGWGFQYAPDKEACQPSVTMTALALKVITKFLKDSTKNGSSINLDYALIDKLSAAKGRGIQYLKDTMEVDTEKGYVYWKYDGKPSLTGTVWVLDFINIAQKQEAGELYRRRREIKDFCISRLPADTREYEEYKEEVYFVGGDTKYKNIKKYRKFYSYLPYHIPVILQSGVNLKKEDHIRIEVCIRALTKGNEDFWIGRESGDGDFQPPTCFVRAMALSVVAFWMRRTWGELIANKLGGDWETVEDDNEESR